MADFTFTGSVIFIEAMVGALRTIIRHLVTSLAFIIGRATETCLHIP